MELKVLDQNPELVSVRAEGSIAPDHFSSDQEPLAELLGKEVYSRRVLLSLDGSDYVNSSGVGWLLVCHKRFREHGGRLVLHSIPKLILNVLKLLRMDQVFQMAEDPGAAREMVMESAP